MTRWVIEEGFLHQFLLAKKHAAWVENERRDKEESTTEGGTECKAEWEARGKEVEEND